MNFVSKKDMVLSDCKLSRNLKDKEKRDVTKIENGERGTGNGEQRTGVWKRVYSGNPYKNSK